MLSASPGPAAARGASPVKYWKGSSPPLLELDFPMVRDRARLREYWGRAAEQVSQLLEEGKEVAFVTLGDPLLYSTYNYLLQALREKHPDLEVETVPGVSSISAAAALAGLPLAQGGGGEAGHPARPPGRGRAEGDPGLL